MSKDQDRLDDIREQAKARGEAFGGALSEIIKTLWPPPDPRIETPNPPDYEALCQHEARKDLWPLQVGLNLLARCHPLKKTRDHAEAKRLLDIARSGIAPYGTLRVQNPDEIRNAKDPAWALVVKPSDLMEWAERKGFDIPIELRRALGMPSAMVSPTDAAVRANVDRRQRRLDLLAQFVEDVYQLGKSAEQNWALIGAPLPITKADFQDLFYECYGEKLGKRVALSTFEGDLADVGAKFAKGTKRNEDNGIRDLLRKRK